MAKIRHIPILTYHSVDDSESVISTAPDAFRRQMKRLNETGYTTISLGTLAKNLIENNEFPENPIVLTFDDGFQNFYTIAFPVLERYGFESTVFLVTDYCGKNNDWDGNPAEIRSSRLLSWGQIKELNACGVEFGSHTRTHPDLSRLPQAAIEREMVGSKSVIEEKLGGEVTTFAYPYGKFNDIAAQIAARNFDAACSTNLGKVTDKSSLYSLERIDSYYVTNQFIFDSFSSRTFDRYMRVRQSLRNFKALVSLSH